MRQLAQRSGAAAGEIRTLIGQSTEQVGASVERIETSAPRSTRWSTGVQDVSQRLRDIADARPSRARDCSEMTPKRRQPRRDHPPERAMVEESATASQELVERAGDAEQRGRIDPAAPGQRRRSPRPGRTRAGHVAPPGLRARQPHLRDPRQGFIDRDLYVFVVDRRGTYRLHAARPAMEGKRVHDVPGIDGDRFVEDAWSRTERDAGWIEYDILNLETGAIQPKASYVRRINDELVVGCGVYRSTGPAAPPAATPRPVASRSHTVALRAAAT